MSERDGEVSVESDGSRGDKSERKLMRVSDIAEGGFQLSVLWHNSEATDYTLGAASRVLEVTPQWLKKKMRAGTLAFTRTASSYRLRGEDLLAVMQSTEYQEHQKRRIYARGGPYVPPELASYHRFHRRLNEFTWLIKCYYSDRTQLRSANVRIDRIFQAYVREQVAPPERISRSLTTGRSPNREAARKALRRLWYYELAYHDPPLSDYAQLEAKGVATNKEASAARLAFPTWRVIQAYYTVYHAVRAILDMLGIVYRPEQHNSPLTTFKNQVLRPANCVIHGFPFSMHYGEDSKGRRAARFLPTNKEHLKYGYSNHRRPPVRPFGEILSRVQGDLRDGWSRWSRKRKEKDIYMFPDFLYDFRCWTNYIDLDNMIALKSEGFRSYLDLDLALVQFFYVGMAELLGLAIFGGDEIVAAANDFFSSFVQRDRGLWESTERRPLEMRFAIYAHLGRINSPWSHDTRPLSPVVEFD